MEGRRRMNYIVNPSVFYLISVLDGIDIACFVAAVCLFGVLIWRLIMQYVDGIDYYKDDEYISYNKSISKKIKIDFVVFAVLTATCILIPSRQDMEKMLIASYATEDNITAATNYGKDLVDYIFERVEKNEED